MPARADAQRPDGSAARDERDAAGPRLGCDPRGDAHEPLERRLGVVDEVLAVVCPPGQAGCELEEIGEVAGTPFRRGGPGLSPGPVQQEQRDGEAADRREPFESAQSVREIGSDRENRAPGETDSGGEPARACTTRVGVIRGTLRAAVSALPHGLCCHRC
jgi:hypothetical protein